MSHSLVTLPQTNTIQSPVGIDYHSIIENGHIVPHFQPIVSIKEKRILGFESLLRGFEPQTQTLIPPYPLLQYARQNGLSCQLQKTMYTRSIDRFGQFTQTVPGGENFFLTLNTDTHLIENQACKLECAVSSLRKKNLPFRNIVFEIIESNISKAHALEEFCALLRKYEFMIALDDFGKGYSNLNRIIAIRPDIIKLDKFLIQNVQNEYYKQEVIKSLINLSHKTGALVIAEGIESEQEALPTLHFNADMLQGYFFDRPHPFDDISVNQINAQLKYMEWIYKKSMAGTINHKRDILLSYDTIISHMTRDFADCDPSRFEQFGLERAGRHTNFECLYILDEKGIQITNTLTPLKRPLKAKSALYQPASPGTDQSNKDYYQFLELGLNKYISDPYISMASGNLCITISVPFINNHTKYVLCIDVLPEFIYS